jgi:gamma-glutamyltranspeptidase/glutathione hydrolase
MLLILIMNLMLWLVQPVARADTLPGPSHRAMVASGHPLATKAGLDILRRGGTAIDAVIAVQAMLGLVEPQSSGIAGGAYLIFYDAKSGKLEGWDGRESAPAAARPDLFLHADGTPMSFHEAAVGGRSVGIPGVMPMLEAVHRIHGKLPWADLVAPAIKQADTGFAIPDRLAGEIAADVDRLKRQQALADYFLQPDGKPHQTGDILVNHAYADALRRLATAGAAALMRGPIAAEIAAAVRADLNPGLMTTDDLAAYQPKQRTPVCLGYHHHRVCSAAPSTSDGVTMLQTLGILENIGNGKVDPAKTDGAFLLLEAERLALADRASYLADPDFAVPGNPTPEMLLEPSYLAQRAALIDTDHAIAHPTPGFPDPSHRGLTPQPGQPEHGTTDIAIIDDDGNAVSMTTTIEDAFGARIMVHGFLLNNELTDFSFMPEQNGRAIANQVQPGKRPRSSMTPSIVFAPDGQLEIVAGSGGGARIIFYVAQTILAMIDQNATPAEALALPHIGAIDRNGDFIAELEADTPAISLAGPLTALNEKIRIVPMNSAGQAIRITPSGPIGAADPRRDGLALAE